MPRGLSQTCIPAKNVAEACVLALVDITESRRQVRQTVEDDWAVTWVAANPSIWRSTGRALELAKAAFPDYLSKIWEQHRKDDEAVLRSLQALCKAAVAQGDDFTIEMTADDFRLLTAYYKS